MQDDIFAAGEADNWFRRNRDHLGVHGDPLTDLVVAAGLQPRSVIEVGAANGYRVAALRERFGCRAVAVDLSEEAVADGRARHPEVEFHVGRIDAVPVADAFDLVVVSFVLHWVDRHVLLRAVAEVDRLVADGGHLALADFLPDANVRVRYGHLPDDDVWTYKQDYPALFVASGLYRIVGSVAGAHGGPVPADDVPSNERVGMALLRKDAVGNYD